MKKTVDITNNIFGRLTALKLDHIKKHSRGSIHFWSCMCICGTERVVNKQKLMCGETTSCGCYQREVAKKDCTTHGLEGHPLLIKWREMIKRCYNPKIKSYRDYGGRGVVVCDEWRHEFTSFYAWAIKNGYEDGLQLDKDIIAKQLGVEALLYSPERCQFVTGKINNNNRRSNRYIEFNGVTKTIAQWSEEYSIKQGVVGDRLRRGWPIEQALTIHTKLTGKRKCLV